MLHPHFSLLLFLGAAVIGTAFPQGQSQGRYEIFEVSENELAARVLRNSGSAAFDMEWSGDLQTWHNSGETAGGLRVVISQTAIGASGGIETIEIAATVNGIATSGLFLRMKAQADPIAPAGFAYIRPGQFAMGSLFAEATRLPNETQHQVTLSRGFFMATTETTWTEWVRVKDWAVNNGYSQLPLAGQNGSLGSAGDNQPVTRVSWYEAVWWCNARSELEGKTPVYYSAASLGIENVFRRGTTSAKVYPNWEANGYRLPTEAEWEYSCRAGTTTPLYTGNIVHVEDTPLDPNTNLAGWYSGNSQSSSQPVAGKQPNAWGLYDMHGNVREFCWDFYLPFTAQAETDPRGLGPDSGKTLRITRGGSYQGFAQHLRSAHRDFFTGPASPNNFTGFRLAMNTGN